MTTALDKIRLAKQAASSLAQAPTALKNEALRQVSLLLIARSDEIISANNLDIQNGQAEDMSESLQDRLRLNHERIASISEAVSKIISLQIQLVM